jgi:glycosyltransferase involved in cell wall biosynthesis
MVGPDRSLQGGIVSVVNGYIDAGLGDYCQLAFVGTGVGSNLLQKSLSFAKALRHYKAVVDNYDIVHLHLSIHGSYRRKSMMARIARTHGKRVILHEHSGEFKDDFEAGTNAYREDVRGTFAIADRVVVLSEEWRDYFADNICDDNKLIVLHNAVKVPPVACFSSENQDILFLGRLGATKSPDMLIRASRQALEMNPNTSLVFGGDGSAEEYEALAKRLGIADRCRFCGWVSGKEKDHLLERAAIFCLPSRHEGMPMSLLESMACGIPSIATSVGGIPQIIDDGINGYLIEPGDESRLSFLLADLLGSPEKRAKIGSSGRQRIAEDFSIDKAVARLVSIYDDLV